MHCHLAVFASATASSHGYKVGEQGALGVWVLLRRARGVHLRRHVAAPGEQAGARAQVKKNKWRKGEVMYKAGKETMCVAGCWRKAGMQGWEAWGQTGRRSTGRRRRTGVGQGSCAAAVPMLPPQRGGKGAAASQELLPAARVFSCVHERWRHVAPVAAAAGGRAWGTPGCAAGQAQWAAADCVSKQACTAHSWPRFQQPHVPHRHNRHRPLHSPR